MAFSVSGRIFNVSLPTYVGFAGVAQAEREELMKYLETMINFAQDVILDYHEMMIMSNRAEWMENFEENWLICVRIEQSQKLFPSSYPEEKGLKLLRKIHDLGYIYPLMVISSDEVDERKIREAYPRYIGRLEYIGEVAEVDDNESIGDVSSKDDDASDSALLETNSASDEQAQAMEMLRTILARTEVVEQEIKRPNKITSLRTRQLVATDRIEEQLREFLKDYLPDPREVEAFWEKGRRLSVLRRAEMAREKGARDSLWWLYHED